MEQDTKARNRPPHIYMEIQCMAYLNYEKNQFLISGIGTTG
jgi:hypothetical protein